MPTLPGVTVSASAVSGSGAPGGNVGTWFITGQTERGPLAPDRARPIRSLADFVAAYGARVSYSVLYDAVDAFFHAGGSRLYVARVVGPAAALSTLTLNDRAGTPAATLTVKPKGPGAYGTRLSVQVKNGDATNSYQLLVFYDGQQVEQTADLFTPTDAVVWSQQASRWVNVTSAGSATAAPNNNPAVLAATALSGGSDDRTNIFFGESDWAAGLARFTPDYGPGMVSAPGRGTSTGHTQLLTHAAGTNREAVLDAPDQSSQATLSGLAIAARAASTADEFGVLAAPWLVVPGVVAGTTRTVPASSITAGRISQQVSTGPANVPAAGDNGEIPWVIDVAQTFTDTERGQLNDDGVIVLRKAYGSSNVTLYGYRTLDTGVWRLLNNQLLRLAIQDECALLGEAFMFDQIDGRGRKLAEFKQAISGVLQGHYDAGELYGADAADAYRVDVGPGVNGAEGLQAGILRAQLSCRMSPFAEQVKIEIRKVPITETLV